MTTTETGEGAYAALKAMFAERHHIHDALGVLGWDRQTMMPDGASAARAETEAALLGMAHDRLVDPRVGDWLDAADAAPPTDSIEAADLREMRRAHRAATALPRALVEAQAKATAAGEMAWRSARANDDFAALAPALDAVLRLAREEAAALSDATGAAPYDALLDRYEPGATRAAIQPTFDALRSWLPDFRETALAAQARADAAAPTPALQGPFDVDAQKALGAEMMAAMGFDTARGRLDVSLHPFCGGADDDVRITTRYDEDDFASALLGVLHETGHALYEQGLPAAWRGRPVGSSRGMALHESQSLFVEMQLARGPAFLSFAAPRIAAAFGRADDPALTAAALSRRFARLEDGFIRVDADEVAYPLHVILRLDLEQALLAGDLAVADLPGAWNDGFEALFGRRPPSDRLGCLQDIHWPSGGFGYFPTYTLGALLAAQFYAAIDAETPDLSDRLAAGDPGVAVAWLRERVHARASSASTAEIVGDACGTPTDLAGCLAAALDAFKAHLKRRYAPD